VCVPTYSAWCFRVGGDAAPVQGLIGVGRHGRKPRARAGDGDGDGVGVPEARARGDAERAWSPGRPVKSAAWLMCQCRARGSRAARCLT
jgi:hypothetical protein